MAAHLYIVLYIKCATYQLQLFSRPTRFVWRFYDEFVDVTFLVGYIVANEVNKNLFK